LLIRRGIGPSDAAIFFALVLFPIQKFRAMVISRMAGNLMATS
jgi:hypothetical protein